MDKRRVRDIRSRPKGYGKAAEKQKRNGRWFRFHGAADAQAYATLNAKRKTSVYLVAADWLEDKQRFQNQ